ncbi:MAG TPA: hypothetical protein VJC03_00130 [bacterium]|nr:hypothetical protein [bacterium]
MSIKLHLISFILLAFLNIAGIFFSLPQLPVLIGAAAVMLSGFLLFLRVLKFLGRIRKNLELAQSGTFTSVYPKKVKNEFSRIDYQLAQVIDLMRQYDDLRASRVSLLQKTINLILKNMLKPLALLDHEKEILFVNPPFKRLAEIDQDEYPWDAVIRNPNNLEFREWFLEYTEKKESILIDKEFHFPAAESRAVSRLFLIPVKNQEEELKRTLIFIGGEDDFHTEKNNTVQGTGASQ